MSKEREAITIDHYRLVVAILYFFIICFVALQFISFVFMIAVPM